MAPTGSDPPAAPGGPAPWDDPTAALHETTNALTVILGWIERAREAPGGSPVLAAALERAARTALATRRALRLAIGAQAADEPSERVAELTARTAEDLRLEAGRAEVEIACATSPDCADWTIAESHAVWQILTNLLLNAIAATPPRGRIELAAEPVAGTDRRVRLTVLDQGPGIAAEQREAVFQAGVTGRSEGAGLGLWHARAQADRHGGRLALADGDGGARFELEWPCALPLAPPPAERAPDENRAAWSAQPPAPTAAPAPCPPATGGHGHGQEPLRGRSVVILEDDRAVAELLELALSARGAAVSSIETPAELADALGRPEVDTLLMDLSPLQGAVDAWMDHARALRPEVAIIVISGSPGEPARANGWVRKPFEPSELVAAIVRAHRR